MFPVVIKFYTLRYFYCYYILFSLLLLIFYLFLQLWKGDILRYIRFMFDSYNFNFALKL